jgi:hypothetical protein
MKLRIQTRASVYPFFHYSTHGSPESGSALRKKKRCTRISFCPNQVDNFLTTLLYSLRQLSSDETNRHYSTRLPVCKYCLNQFDANREMGFRIILLVNLMRVRILPLALMRIRNLPFTFMRTPDPNPSFQIKTHTLKKCSNYFKFHTFLACHLQIDWKWCISGYGSSLSLWCGSGSYLSIWCGSMRIRIHNTGVNKCILWASPPINQLGPLTRPNQHSKSEGWHPSPLSPPPSSLFGT